VAVDSGIYLSLKEYEFICKAAFPVVRYCQIGNVSVLTTAMMREQGWSGLGQVEQCDTRPHFSQDTICSWAVI